MNIFSDLCLLCHNVSKDLKTILIEDNEGKLFETKLKYCIPEIGDSKLEIPKYICSNCICKLDCFYLFKQMCVQNYINLKNSAQTLSSGDKIREDLSVKSIEKQENNQQLSLPIVENDVEPRIKVKEENDTCNEEAESKFSNDSYPLFDEEKHFILKEESLTSEDNADTDFCPEFVKCEPNLGDSDVSLSSNEDLVEDSEDSNSSGENNSTKRKRKKEECLTSEDNADTEFCPEFVKCEPNLGDSDVSVSSNEDLVEDSEDSNSSSENNSIKGKRKKEECLSSQDNTDSSDSISVSDTENNIFEDTKVSNNTSETNETNSEEKNNIKTPKKYLCVLCSKIFTNITSFRYHVKVHAGIKDLSCSVCDKKFTRRDCLYRHEKIHKGIKSHECSICTKRFMRKGDLTKHEQIHSNTRDYECSQCTKKFLYKIQLCKHQKIHESKHT